MYKICILILSLLVISCKHNDSGDTQSACTVGGVGETNIDDISGDASFSFIDITNTNVVVTESEITVTIGLLEIPALLTYNNQNVPFAAIEYSWEIMFDTNCDGSFSGDTGLSVKYFRFGDVETQGSILDFTQHNVWQARDDGSGVSNEGDINANLDGNNLVLSVSKDVYEKLLQIDNRTPYRVVTIYNSSGSRYYDSLPDGYPSMDRYTNL